ncbi:hypothetical protein [Spirilliplanes yamanashiensis]|uniref:Uncharacterized protein n=1 Tax=Spirilliplanes yamanashiensis TaxID=42233 RepID=A0A8J4DIU5_9ACTN|nr:hypothetical protein [Spirilliplanes yamanashiensis]MDP9814672.1 hypothetical protein [Spirilliplanes yamanashiensis]GIJ02325.1 hypothetical protein Sya03_16770 [Spirilliplanes yamanashiensis]
MDPVAGTWDVTLRTPIGTLTAVYTFTDAGGTVTGAADGAPLTDVACADVPAGRRVTWRQAVTRPMRLNLEFDVVVVGDAFAGHSRAGRLPRTVVTGTRRRPPA